MNILECPFCHKNKTKIDSKTANRPHYIGSKKYVKYTASVRCNCCHSRGPTASIEVEATGNGCLRRLDALKTIENKAIELWNNR